MKELSSSSESEELFSDISSSFKHCSVWTSHCINARQYFFKSKSLSCSVCYKSVFMSFSVNIKSLVFCHFIKDCTSEAAEFCNESASLCVLLSL